MDFIGIDWNNLAEPLSKEEIRELFNKIAQGDELAREKLAYHNIRLVVYLIRKKFFNAKCDAEELISLGLEILVKAIDTYDINRNVDFANYACICIKNRILNYLRDLKKEEQVISLNVPVHGDEIGDNNIELINMISSDIDIQEECIQSIDEENILNLVSSLPSSQRKIIIWYYYKQYTQRQIAEKIGVTPRYAGILIKKALKNLGDILIKSGVVELDSYSK